MVLPSHNYGQPPTVVNVVKRKMRERFGIVKQEGKKAVFVPVDPRYPKMYVLGIDDSLKDLGMNLGFNQFFLSIAPDSKYLTDGYIFRAEFIQWYESQNYPFCKLKGVDFELDEHKTEEEPYPFHVDNLDLTKRAIMEDHGFKTGY